jgi:hypothetical protein
MVTTSLHIVTPEGTVSSQSLFAFRENWEYPVSTGIDLAEEIRQYFIPDFSNWEDRDLFQKGFEKLVKDLKSSDFRAISAATAK